MEQKEGKIRDRKMIENEGDRNLGREKMVEERGEKTERLRSRRRN